RSARKDGRSKCMQPLWRALGRAVYLHQAPLPIHARPTRAPCDPSEACRLPQLLLVMPVLVIPFLVIPVLVIPVLVIPVVGFYLLGMPVLGIPVLGMRAPVSLSGFALADKSDQNGTAMARSEPRGGGVWLRAGAVPARGQAVAKWPATSRVDMPQRHALE